MKVGDFLAHEIICQYCKERFDRDKIPYVQISNMRYGHASCYLKEKEKGNIKLKKELQIIDPTNIVSCIYCKQKLNKSNEKYIKISEKKYAHQSCYDKEQTREKTDAEKLDIYICKLFKTEYVNPLIRKQINNYIKQYKYTYSGIHKALKYFYEYKNGDIEKANGSIAIIPYIYQDAYNYYYSLWQAKQKNKDKDIVSFIPKVIEVTIKPPERNVKQKINTFNFLEKDKLINEQ